MKLDVVYKDGSILETSSVEFDGSTITASDGVYHLDINELKEIRANNPEEYRIKTAEKVLVDNGVEEDEADTVLQTIGHVLLDEELYPDKYDGNENENPKYRKRLYDLCYALASERPEFEPSENDTVEDLLEKYFHWGFEYNQTYFPELDVPESKKDAFTKWLSSKWEKYYRLEFPSEPIGGMDTDKAKEVFEEYVEEMTAEGAWCAHCYPQEYLHDIFFKVRELLQEEWDCLGSVEKKEHRELIDQVREMEYDLDELTNKMYGSDSLSPLERNYIGDLIAEKFKKTLEKGIKLLCRYYKNHTGEKLGY